MKNRKILYLVFILFLSIGVTRSQDISYLGAGGKLKSLQAIMDIRHYTLALTVNIEQRTIDGYVEIDLILSESTDTLLFDLVHLLQVKKVLVNKEELIYSQKNDAVCIIGKIPFKQGKQTVRIYYGGNPPVAVNPPWLGGFTWTKDKNGNPWVAINCQGQGAKIYYPCKDHPSDEPNEGADLFITVPNGLTVAGPGLLQEVKRRKGNESTWHWKTRYTISTYCIVFNIGKYKMFGRPYTTVNGNIVPIQLYLLEQDTARAEFLLDIKVRDTHILEKYFGEYPWVKEKIGIVEVPNSGMEHQTMITFKDSLTFIKYPGGVEYSDVFYHEYAHEWFANKITNRDWSDMWIQEGIATYAEALFMKDAVGEAAYDSLMLENKNHIVGKMPIVMGEDVSLKDINWDIYPKGAFLMHTLRYMMGDSVFFPALKKLSTDLVFPYERNFTSEDIEKHFSKAAGKNLKPLFDLYLKSTKRIDIGLLKIKPDTYQIYVYYSPMTIPIDILTSAGIIHADISTGQNITSIVSKTQPLIDTKDWYFKRVTIY